MQSEAKLPKLNPPRALLNDLLNNRHQKSKSFVDNNRTYNIVFTIDKNETGGMDLIVSRWVDKTFIK